MPVETRRIVTAVNLARIQRGGMAVARVCAAYAQAPGGFTESATGNALRPRLSAGEIQAFVPQRGRFTFPSPYGTTGVRLTNASDCGGSDCVNYVGYSYWRNINNHAGSDTMLIFLGLNRQRGGGGPTLFSYNKNTGETRNLGPLFSPTARSPGRRARGGISARAGPRRCTSTIRTACCGTTSTRRRWKPSSTCASTSGPTSTSSRSTRATTTRCTRPPCRTPTGT